MDEGTISGGSVVWVLDANQAALDASLAEAQGKVEAYAVAVDAANKTVETSAATVAASAESSSAKTVAASAASKDAQLADDDEVISKNALTVASFNALGNKLENQVGISKTVGIGAAVVAAGVAVSAGIMVKAAGDFQASMTRLATSAGESYGNLQLVSKGVLQIARDTGTSTTQLASAMYIAESGGQHGAAGLNVLKAAAQGAKTENADLATVTDAVTSAMTDYHYSADQAATVTSKLVAATGQGKTTFQDLASAMPAILPVASAAHISLNEILGDLASMTMHGISADQASQNLASTIRSLQSPTQAASKELAALGLNSTQLSQNLGTKGLYGTLQEISQAIQDRMGKGATSVILNMEDALKGLPQAVQDVSQQVLNGTATWTDWNKATKNLTVTQKAQATSFATLVNGMHTIGTEQLSGSKVMQTYAGAMNKAIGTSDGLNVALMLTGQNSGNTANAIKAVTSATADASGNVKGWSEIQGNFNQQMSMLKEDLTTTGIAIGTALLPPLTSFAKTLAGLVTPATDFISRNKDLVATLFILTGVLASVVAIAYGVTKAMASMKIATELLGTGSIASGAKIGIFGEALVATRTAAIGLAGSFTSLWAVINGESLAADATNPIFAIITVISLLALGIYEVIKHWNTVKDWMVDFWNHWKIAILGFMAFFAPEMLVLAGVADIIVRNWTPIKQFFTHLWDDITKVTDIFTNGISSRVDLLTKHIAPYWGAIHKDAVDAWQGINQDVHTAVDKLQSDLDSILGRLTDHISPHWDAFKVDAKSAFEDMRHTVGSGLTNITNDILTWGGDAHQALLPAWLQFKTDAITTWDGMRADSVSAFKGLKTDIHKSITDIVTDANSLWHGLSTGSIFTTIGHSAGTLLKNGWDSTTHDAKQWGTDVANNIGKGFDDVKRNAPQWGKDIVNGIKKGLEALVQYDLSSIIRWKDDLVQGYQKAFSFGRSLVDDIGHGFTAAGRDLVQWGKDIVTNVGKGFTIAVRAAVQWGKNVIQDVGSGFSASVKDAVQWGKDVMTNIGNGLTSGIGTITSFFARLPSDIAEFLKNSGQSIASFHLSGFSSLWKDSGKMKTLGDDILKGIGIAVGAVIVGIVLLAISIVIALINGIVDALKWAVGGLVSGLNWIKNEIVGFFGDAGSWLFDAGKAILNGLVNGIKAVAEAPVNAVKDVLSKVSKLLPHSPAEEGPFSGKGWTLYSGMAISQALAQGIKATGSQAVSAMTGVMQGVANVSGAGPSTTVGTGLGDTTATSIINGLSSGSGAGAGGPVLHVHLNQSGIVARSRSEWRDIMKDGINAVNEELKAKRVPLIGGGALSGRSTA